MTTEVKTVQLSDFKKYIRKMKSYEEAIALLSWDLRTGAPKKGAEFRSDSIGDLYGEYNKMLISDQMAEFLEHFLQNEVITTLGDVERKMLTECKREYDFSKKIPPEKLQEYVVLTTKTESLWSEAKGKNDWDSFAPSLQKIVDTNIEFAELRGYEGHRYNALLDNYEPGITVEKLDEVFGALREKVVPLLAAIRQSPNQPDCSFLDQAFDKDKQRQFSLDTLKQLGYDFEAGRLDETVHPFMTGINPRDSRITTRYLPRDVRSALFGTIHECGHAMYEQNISEELSGTNLNSGTSMGIHESQSRFWENVIGRSKQFWAHNYDALKAKFPGQLDDVGLDDFYRACNHAESTLIRIEADELTYNFHIMIRYELEKALIGGTLQVSDLPEAWNEKYREYLGIEPSSYSEGVMQDVHWSAGLFGYFPSYSLGNMYAAQMLNKIENEFLPNFYELIEAGDFAPIKTLLTEHVYQYGKLLTPNEIIERMTGEELNPEYLVKYLTDKYSPIYGL
ncbi:carboxypeptidase M32 [Paenibacillus sp. N1-5-1-14]|uniref:carboxypeptidase M32 n=1 Tax=Paenibacillus radicibacter TaxID=2972488 RepID=UPI002158B735|nr:carboxypeptidase M32 [Paenibacillus radicibacter]MCR8641633.1 carboxypeptidase M32 [Paenibacillus radicibacter]